VSIQSEVYPVWAVRICIGLMVLNLVALVPYGLGLNYYPLVTLGFSLGCWVLFVLAAGMVLSFSFVRGMYSHQLPLRRPVALWGVLPLLERIRLGIQPLTLLLRITANLAVGHFLLFFSRKMRWGLALILRFALLWFERFVALIQSVVFTLLLMNYSKFLTG